MSFDLRRLFSGELVYAEPWAALDNVRFDRIIHGFEEHYDVVIEDATQFRFMRGEGYLRLERWDAFGSVDGGTVARLRDPNTEPTEFGGNVVAMQPRFAALQFTLNVRVMLVYWMLGFVAFGLAIGGQWLFWLAGFVVAIIANILLIRWSLRRKLKRWLARESWN
jgi:hypothetical protein